MEFYCTRMCKSIMKKLSISRDIQFKGKIQSLLSSILPLNHKSGLNVSGRFSLQRNNFRIESREEIGPRVTEAEYKVYKNFWSLQKYLVHPHSIFTNKEVGLEEYSDEDSEMSYCEDETLPSGEKYPIKMRLNNSIDRESGALDDMEPGQKIDESQNDDYIVHKLLKVNQSSAVLQVL